MDRIMLSAAQVVAQSVAQFESEILQISKGRNQSAQPCRAM